MTTSQIAVPAIAAEAIQKHLENLAGMADALTALEGARLAAARSLPHPMSVFSAAENYREAEARAHDSLGSIVDKLREQP
jgi:hypothetical protein